MSVCQRVIVVVYGEIKDEYKDKIETYTKEILIRDNSGYDGEAYSFTILNYWGKQEVDRYDELLI